MNDNFRVEFYTIWSLTCDVIDIFISYLECHLLEVYNESTRALLACCLFTLCYVVESHLPHIYLSPK